MKNIVFFISLIFLFSLGNKVNANEVVKDKPTQTDTVQTPAVVSYTNYRDCIKLYKLPVEKLFFLTLSAINANKFDTLEMQSRNGYIIFEEEGREFLLNVMKKDKNYTFLRLTPADNNYYFSPQIPQKIFNYIDANLDIEVKELKL